MSMRLQDLVHESALITPIVSQNEIATFCAENSPNGYAANARSSLASVIHESDRNKLKVNTTMEIFPNPSSSWVDISIVGFTGPIEISLLNQIGQKIIVYDYTLNDDNNSPTYKLNIEDLAPGTYFIRCSDGSNSITRTLIVSGR
jgi:hypothetical protein